MRKTIDHSPIKTKGDGWSYPLLFLPINTWSTSGRTTSPRCPYCIHPHCINTVAEYHRKVLVVWDNRAGLSPSRKIFLANVVHLAPLLPVWSSSFMWINIVVVWECLWWKDFEERIRKRGWISQEEEDWLHHHHQIIIIRIVCDLLPFTLIVEWWISQNVLCVLFLFIYSETTVHNSDCDCF